MREEALMDREGIAEVPGPERPERPGVVEEADEVLATYGWQLVGAGAAGAAAWVVSTLYVGLSLPLPWLVLYLIVLVILYTWPMAREPRLAREVIRRWDDLRVERALETAGLGDDPRLEVARSMAERVLRHPSVEERVRATIRALVNRLEVVLKDLRRVEWLMEGPSRPADRHRTRSISDLMDVLDARVASILGQIAEIHRTVVLRDALALERALDSVDDLLRDLEAEQEVDRLLAGAERRGGES